MKSYQKFFAELKRRKVFRVAAVYGAVAFALLQVADPLASALRLPDSFVPFVVALLLLGFPVALVLAWAFEVTPDGVHRTKTTSEAEIEEIAAQPMSKRWLSGILALVGVGALVVGAWWAGRHTAPSSSEMTEVARADSIQLAYSTPEEAANRPSIAVLPFADMSPEGDQEYFSDGMTEEIYNTLAKIQDLSLQGRTSAFAYKDRNEDLRLIGDQLGVSYLVEGSVRKAGDQLRISAQLIDAETGRHIWSDTYDRRLDDVFAIQTEIAEAIADELRVPLGLEEDETLVTPTGDLTAYDLYLSGRNKMRQRGAALLEAIELFEGAIARDSSWAPAWAALAEAREIRIFYSATFPTGWTRQAIERSLDEAETAVERALELDSTSASAWVALGSIHRDRGRWQKSERSYRRALELDRDNPEAHQQYSDLLAIRGRIAESVRAADRAAALDPAPVRVLRLGINLRLDDRTQTALQVLEFGLRQDPGASLSSLRAAAGYLYMLTGRTEAAIASYREWFREIEERAGSDSLPPIEELEAGIRYVSSGDTSARPPEDFEEMAPPRALLAAGREEAAIAGLDRVEDLAAYLPGWDEIWDPLFDPIRADPRVRTFMEEQGIGDAELQRTPRSERTRPLILQGDGPGETP